MLTDALIISAQSGDRHAVNEFLAACVPVVRGVAMKTLGASNQMVDDAVQESLIKLWRNMHMYRGGNLTGWVIRVTRNTCYDMVRYIKPDQVVSIDDVPDICDHSCLADDAIMNERVDSVLQAIYALGDTHRLAVQLVDIGGAEYAEAAHIMNVPIGTIKSHVHRGRLMVAKALQDAA